MVIAFSYSRRNCCFFTGGKISPFHVKPYKILFKGVQNVNSSKQTEFTGVPFVVLGSKMMDCTHGTDLTLPRKRKKLEEKKGNLMNYYFA